MNIHPVVTRLLDEKLRIASCILCFAGLATFLAFKITPKYEAKLVASFNLERKYRNPLRAALHEKAKAATDLPKSVLTTAVSREAALAYLQSRKLIEGFIEKNNLMPILFPKQWDGEKKAWKNNDPQRQPTPWQAYKLFKGLWKVKHDMKTGLVDVSLTWKDPELAADWTNKLIMQANHDLREMLLTEAEQGLKVLGDELHKTPFVDVQRTAHQIVEAELKAALVMRTNEDFAFDVIDPAQPPERDAFVKPNRPLIIFIGVMGGLAVGCLWVCLRYFRQRYRRRVGEIISTPAQSY